MTTWREIPWKPLLLEELFTDTYSRRPGNLSLSAAGQYHRLEDTVTPPDGNEYDYYLVRIVPSFRQEVWDYAEINVRLEGDGEPRVMAVWPETEIDPNQIGVVIKQSGRTLALDLGVKIDASGVGLPILAGATAGGKDSQIVYRMSLLISIAAQGGGVAGSRGWFNLKQSPPNKVLYGDSHCILVIKSKAPSPVWLSYVVTAYPLQRKIRLSWRDPVELSAPSCELPR